MYFASFAELLQMGGHGFYVWLAYGVTALVLLLLCIVPCLQRRSIVREFSQRAGVQSSNLAAKAAIPTNEQEQ
ncbi:MAG: heme exporter protein CcmD [Pseudomonadales bacterium]